MMTSLRAAPLAACLVTLAAAAVPSAPAAAQQIRFGGPVPPAQPAWLGVSYEVRWLFGDGVCESRVVVEGVVHGAPAERAGLRPGDAITAVNGEPLSAARLRTLTALIAPGDTVRLRVDRTGRLQEVTAVADRRPQHPPRFGIDAVASGFAASSAPIVWARGDTLVARNVGDPPLRRVPGYWLASSDGRTEFRSLTRRDRDDLDRRVEGLLRCAAANSTPSPAPSAAPRRFALTEILPRADSLRILMARSALEAQTDRESYRFLLRPDPDGSAAPYVEVHAGDALFLRLEDHLTAARRGVAGAELTELEPELAAYFGNVREGLLVLRVAPASPADRAGLRAGDVIVTADGRRPESVAALRSLLARPAADPVELRVVRKGRTRTLTLGPP